MDVGNTRLQVFKLAIIHSLIGITLSLMGLLAALVVGMDNEAGYALRCGAMLNDGAKFSKFVTRVSHKFPWGSIC